MAEKINEGALDTLPPAPVERSPGSAGDRALDLLHVIFIASILMAGWGKIDIELSRVLVISMGGTTRAMLYIVFGFYTLTRIIRRDFKKVEFIKDPVTLLGISAIISTLAEAKGDFFIFTSTYLPALMGYYVMSYLLKNGKGGEAYLGTLSVFAALIILRGFAEVKGNFFVNPTIMSTSSEHHTIVAMIIISVFPLSLSLLLRDSKRRLSYIALLIILLIGLILANSRIGWFSSFIVIFYMAFAIRSTRVRLTLFAIMLGGFIASIFFFPHLHKRFLSLFNAVADPDFLARLDVWRFSLAIIRDHFLLGVGFSTNAFKNAGAIYMQGFPYTHPHNVFLSTLVYTGIIGFSLFLWILWKTLGSLRALSGIKSMKDASTIIALKGSLLGVLLVNMLDTMFTSSRATLVIFLLLAYVFYLKETQDRGCY